jgi:hypothetical protein
MTLTTHFDGTRAQAEKACRDGQFADADRIYSLLLAGGQDGPACSRDETQALLRGHAMALYGLRRFSDGEAQLRRALGGYEDTPMVPAAVETLVKLADAIGEQDRWIEAEALVRDAVRRGEVALGEQHEATLIGRLSLAWAHSRQDRWEEAMWFAEAVHADMVRSLGADHRLTLSAGNLLANCLLHTGSRERAEERAEAVFQSRSAVLGQAHPHTIAIVRDLARIRVAVGKLDEALRLAEEFLPTATGLLGEDHPFTVGLLEIRDGHAPAREDS